MRRGGMRFLTGGYTTARHSTVRPRVAVRHYATCNQTCMSRHPVHGLLHEASTRVGKEETAMSTLISPHGSATLKPLLLDAPEREAELARVASLTRVPLTTRETGDLIMMGIGAFTPLEGFMGYEDWQGACDTMS